MAAALLAGAVAALAVTGIAARASNASIAATPANTWDPSSATIQAGEQVTWSNAGGLHNVCVLKPGSSGPACDEFRSGDPGSAWTSVSHAFTTPGAYTFYCEVHGSATAGMRGTITVEPAATTTTTTTTTTTESQPTETTTTPAPAPDPTAPAFVGKLKRRASRKAIVLDFTSSEVGTLQATVYRRAPHARHYRRMARSSLAVAAGRNVVKLTRPRLRPGAYRVRLQLIDAAGNASPVATIAFRR